VSVDPFVGLDQVALHRVAERFGNAFAQATALNYVDLARDDAISPEAFAAGLCKAHCLGLASAINSAGAMGQDAAALAEALAGMLVGMVRLSAEMRAS
jgi:hypothetical protein